MKKHSRAYTHRKTQHRTSSSLTLSEPRPRTACELLVSYKCKCMKERYCKRPSLFNLLVDCSCMLQTLSCPTVKDIKWCKHNENSHKEDFPYVARIWFQTTNTVILPNMCLHVYTHIFFSSNSLVNQCHGKSEAWAVWWGHNKLIWPLRRFSVLPGWMVSGN